MDYELFKSEVCQRVKSEGYAKFLFDVLSNDLISQYYNEKKYFECLYLLAMVDYQSRIHDVPLCNRYEKLRHCKLDRIIYPKSILALDALLPEENYKEIAVRESIPEFIRFNIVEAEVDNVA
ncbi:MAG: hypothetical protein K6F49_11760 [Saccharofermentans sp.]|nr:hypothetical protein [Saccharofermentans sp.]